MSGFDLALYSVAAVAAVGVLMGLLYLRREGRLLDDELKQRRLRDKTPAE